MLKGGISLHCARKKATKVGLTATVSGKVYWTYPILPFGIVLCTFFPTTFLEIAVFKFHRRSCKVSFFFPPHRQSAPENLLAGRKLPIINLPTYKPPHPPPQDIGPSTSKQKNTSDYNSPWYKPLASPPLAFPFLNSTYYYALKLNYREVNAKRFWICTAKHVAFFSWSALFFWL